MSHEKIVWTVLPAGQAVIGGKKYLKLTVAISPRLYAPGAHLSDYPDWIDWPATLKNAKFDLLFHSPAGTKGIVGKPDPKSSNANSTTWGYLFGKSTPVVPYQFQDWSPRFIQTTPATVVHDSLKDQYQSLISRYAAQPPPYAILHRVVSKLWPDGFPSPYTYKRYLGTYKKGRIKTFPPAQGLSDGLLQLELFYHRGPDGNGWQFAKPWPAQGQTLDFHQQVSSLTKFWQLQRHLGIAVDLLVPFAIIPAGAGSVRLVNPLYGPSGDITPQTRYVLAGGALDIASKTGTMKGGMVDLSSAEYTLTQIDVDGAGIKFVGLARQIFSSNANVGQTQSRTRKVSTEPLPSLRSGGLSLLRRGRSTDLALALPQSTSSNTQAEAGNGSKLEFYAEDLVHGYRVDIWDSMSGKWHSLHKREAALDPADNPNDVPPARLPGSYEFLKASGAQRFFTPSGDDEGFVSMGMTSDPNGPSNGGPGPDVYLHEELWRWMGWSLSAQRPNLFAGLDDTPDSYDASQASVGSGVQLLTHFGAAGGSLPKLRFGRRYRLRARIVDLAANSLPAQSPADAYETPPKTKPPFVYRRFEPVITPPVVLHDAIAATPADVGSPGESIHRLVIRSNRGKTAAAELAYLSGSGAGELGYGNLPPQTTRWIVPPRMSQLMAEHHSMFDKGSGWRPDALQIMSQYDTSLADQDPSKNELPDTVHGGATLTMPYLPDILAQGATFVGLPGVPPGKPFGPKGSMPGGRSLSFTAPADPRKLWPLFKPFRLTVKGLNKGAPAKPPIWDPGARILTVFVEQASMVQDPISKTWDFPKANLSAFLAAPGLEVMGIWGWLEEYQAAGKISATQLAILHKLALAGLCWALTPSQDITFIHATQQPLIKPAFVKLRSIRTILGGTDALLIAMPMKIDGMSTTKVDIEARWTDPRDDLTLDPCPQLDTIDVSKKVIPGLPKQNPTTAHVVEIPLDPGATVIDFTAKNGYRHKFGDTKHHWVNYTATATTRFLEYFPNDSRLATTWTSPVAKVNVFSSARPQSPKILYAVPAFGWKTAKGAKLTTSLRTGGWLRVYLDRPFYSSGPDELLGVVLISNSKQIDGMRKGRARRLLAAHGLARNNNAGVTTVLEKYVTQWGMDPLWNSPTIQNPPMTTDFPTATSAQTGLYLEELGGLRGKIPVGVAGFPVTYDDTRCLYYADIPFKWGNSYFPFVRMALASYQPYSMAFPDTVHLSRVIMTDFVQLAPNRLAQVQTHSKASDPKFVQVTVTGVTPTGGGAFMEVTVEQQAPQIGPSSDELSWIPVPNLDTVMTASKIANSELSRWSAGFDLPHPVGSVPFRLIIREYELHPREWGVYVPPKPPSVHKDAVVIPRDSRLVYAATLQI